MIQTIKGDLFTTTSKVIAHGCNCSGGFGSGIAGIISNNYPVVRDAYMNKYKAVGWSLGEIQGVKYDLYKYTFINCATQQFCGSNGKDFCYFDYIAFEVCLNKINLYLISQGIKEFSIPKIGAGLAGGDWNKIYAIIEKLYLNNNDILIKIYEL